MNEFFFPDYETARSRFRAGAAKIGARLEALNLEARSPRGDVLSIDIAWIGPASPERVLLHSSGLHGVEAFAGSAVQLQFLADPPRLPVGTAVVLVHVLNPYGMAWLRRTNEHNVDLNRNFLAEDETYAGAPDGYHKIADFLNPSRLGFGDLFWLRAGWLLLRYGLPPLMRTTVSGQYDDPAGLFFGGEKLEAGPHLYQEYLARHLASARRVVAVDVHTGLGPAARDTILTGEKEAGRFGAALGPRLRVRSASDPVAYAVRGGMDSMLRRVLAQADVDYLCQEIGTYAPLAVLRALRRENYWHHRGGDADWAAKGDLKTTFAPQNARWEVEAVRRGRELLDAALAALAAWCLDE